MRQSKSEGEGARDRLGACWEMGGQRGPKGLTIDARHKLDDGRHSPRRHRHDLCEVVLVRLAPHADPHTGFHGLALAGLDGHGSSHVVHGNHGHLIVLQDSQTCYPKQEECRDKVRDEVRDK